MKNLKKLVLATIVSTVSLTSFAGDETGGTVIGNSDVDNLSQAQTSSISNSNVAQMVNQLNVQNPLSVAPRTSMGKDFDDCSNDYSFVTVGGSKAQLSNVGNNGNYGLGDGSWAVGAQVGRVFVHGNDSCIKRQKIRLRDTTLKSQIERQVQCISYANTMITNFMDPIEYIARHKEDAPELQQCRDIVTEFVTNRAASMKKTANAQILRAQNAQPQYTTVNRRVQDGWHEFRVYLGEFKRGCNTCSTTLGNYVDRLKEAGFGEDVIIKQMRNGTAFSVSVKTHNALLTKSAAEALSGKLYHKGFPGGEIRGNFGAERWVHVKETVRVK